MMTARQPYPNAPIAEAVLEIQCSVGEGVGLSALEAVQAGESERYPRRHKFNEMRAQFQAHVQGDSSEPIAGSAQRTQSGFVSVSEDQLQVFHARLDRFVFARLRPYLGWEAFSAEARRLWAVYRAATNPVSIDRIAIRTINRLVFPAPIKDPGEYLQTMPTIGDGVGKSIDGYFMQVAVPQPEVEGVALITQAVDQPQSPDQIAIILDIDLSRTTSLPQEDTGLWELLGRMRHKKDDVFEACITDRTRELFTQ